MEMVDNELNKFYQDYDTSQKHIKLFVSFDFNDIDSTIDNEIEIEEPKRKKKIIPNIVVHNFSKQNKNGLF